MKHKIFISLITALTCLTACDDGRIYSHVDVDSFGRSLKLTGTLTGLDNWTSDYYVAVAGFTSDSEYASISKRVKADANGNVSIVMNNIPDDVTKVQLCVLDRLRRHVVTLQEADIEGIRDTIRMDVSAMDASMFGAIQKSFLNTTCVNCHGASNHSAAGLNLTEGHALADMVGVDSKRVSGHKIVEAGNASSSVHHMVLHDEHVDSISMNHFDLVSEDNANTLLPMIDNWIDNGVK